MPWILKRFFVIQREFLTGKAYDMHRPGDKMLMAIEQVHETGLITSLKQTVKCGNSSLEHDSFDLVCCLESGKYHICSLTTLISQNTPREVR